ncbi:MAG: DUF983 domain-containing protein [Candidatus Acidiferrales bacterium]
MKPPFSQALRRGLRFRCPNCGEGRVFSSFFKMRDECPVCGLSFYPESGYYAGAMYLDYALSAAVFLAVFVPSLFLPELTHLSYAQKNILWIVFGTVLCLGFSRPSYSLWLAIDYWISPWKPQSPQKSGETLEVPLVSMVIRTDKEGPRHGTHRGPEN